MIADTTSWPWIEVGSWGRYYLSVTNVLISIAVEMFLNTISVHILIFCRGHGHKGTMYYGVSSVHTHTVN